MSAGITDGVILVSKACNTCQSAAITFSHYLIKVGLSSSEENPPLVEASCRRARGQMTQGVAVMNK